jgi:ABC-type sugar transport system substrate-binding protein
MDRPYLTHCVSLKSVRTRVMIPGVAATIILAGFAGQHAFAADDAIGTASFDTTSDNFLRWNKDSCVFEPANGPAGKYEPVVRKSPKPLRIVFTPEEQANAVFVAEAKKLVDLGKAANIEVTVLDNAYPDTGAPVRAADQAVQLKVDLVLSQLILPDLNPVVQTKYRDACIPMINIFGMPKYPFPAPTIQAIHGDNGIDMAKAAIGLIKKKGWPADQIWIVSCGEPQVASGPGTAEDLMVKFRDAVKAEFKVPDDRISPILLCSQADGPLGSKVAVTDWLTAHPNAKYVVGSAWNDVRAFGMAQGLEASGYTRDNAITAGRDANKEQLAAMKGGSTMQVDLDLNLVDGWATAMLAVAQDVLAGKPVPARNVPAAKALTPDDL